MNVYLSMADVSRVNSLLAFIILTPISLMAEDSAPKDFYRHDYAKSTYERKEEEKLSGVKKESKVKKKSKEAGSAGIIDADPGFKEMKEEKAPEVKEDTSYLEKDGNEVLSVGLITSADNESHTIENINELLELAIKNDWGIGEVYLVGSNKGLINKPELIQFMRQAAFRLGSVSYKEKVPEKYAAVKKSPAWIVQTEKGQVILEAVGPLRKKFNKNGELTE